MTNIWLRTFANTLGVTKISLRETSKLLEESRRIAEHETEDDSSSIFLKMILQIVMAMDERMKKKK